MIPKAYHDVLGMENIWLKFGYDYYFELTFSRLKSAKK
jgi:hypothetical protein